MIMVSYSPGFWHNNREISPEFLCMDLTTLASRLSTTQDSLLHLTADEQFALLQSRAFTILKPDLLKQRLKTSRDTGKPMIVKYGIDPTSPDVHLGHIVPLIVANWLQKMGHHFVLVIGDFTALIGDPSGRVAARPVLTREQVEANVTRYKEQIAKFVDIHETEVVFNSSYTSQISLAELLEIYGKVKLGPILQRDDFRHRMDGITIAEVLYPTFMAIDSVKIQPDLELGGKDQLLNFQATIDVQEAEGQIPESALCVDLLLGPNGDGSKMSKSKNNYIGVLETAPEVFGKLMSIPDSLLELYYTLLTAITKPEWQEVAEDMESGSLNPLEVKRVLARYMVTVLHGAKAAEEADQAFRRQFSEHAIPDNIPVYQAKAGESIIDILEGSGTAPTRSEARRLVTQGGVWIFQGEEKTQYTDFGQVLPTGEYVLKVGKRRFVKVVR
jgi:tyrosyl-tRNA synthetase